MPKRDIDRIREILLEAEAVEVDPEEDMYSGFVDYMDKITPKDSYQLTLMKDAGLVAGRDASLGLFRVTNSGHDFLDAVRDDGVWNKTKSKIAHVGGSATLDVVKAVAVSILTTALGLGV